MITRGMRNCNPGNIRISADGFRGEVVPSQDKSFKQFKNMDYGYRAIIVILQAYQRRYGLKTIRGMIGRWAPPNENDTNAYIKRVVTSTGYAADDIIDMQQKDVAVKMARAISESENSWHDTEAAMQGFDLL